VMVSSQATFVFGGLPLGDAFLSVADQDPLQHTHRWQLDLAPEIGMESRDFRPPPVSYELPWESEAGGRPRCASSGEEVHLRQPPLFPDADAASQSVTGSTDHSSSLSERGPVGLESAQLPSDLILGPLAEGPGPAGLGAAASLSPREGRRGRGEAGSEGGTSSSRDGGGSVGASAPAAFKLKRERETRPRPKLGPAAGASHGGVGAQVGMGNLGRGEDVQYGRPPTLPPSYELFSPETGPELA